MQHGLLKASFIPSREDVLPLLYKILRPKLDDITLSLESITTPLQRALLWQILDHIDDLDRRVAILDGMVEQYMANMPRLWTPSTKSPALPGAVPRGSWRRLCWTWNGSPVLPTCVPGQGCLRATIKVRGNRSTAGRTKAIKSSSPCWPSARKREGRRRTLIFTHNTNELPLDGANRATIAVAHSILTVIWHMLKHNVPYRDLRTSYYDGFHREHKIKGYLKRLQALGREPEPPAVPARDIPLSNPRRA